MYLLRAYLSDHRIKNLIIILVVSALAFQTIYYIHSFAVNIPRQDEWFFVPFIVSFHDGKAFWQYIDFWQHGDHRQIIPNLISLANVTLTSWNVVYQMYFGWVMLVLSVWIIFLILRKTLTNLKWLIILIAAFLFNTSQVNSLLWALASNASFTATAGIVASIYFLNKEEFKKSTLVFAILSAWIASFSEIHGLMVWVVGMFSLFHKAKRTHLIIWLINTVLVFSLFFITFDFNDTNLPTDFRGKVDVKSLFSLQGIQFILLFLANGLVPHVHAFYSISLLIGGVIVSLMVVVPAYFHFKKIGIRKIMPWIQLGIIGLLTAMMTEIGRLGLEDPILAIRWMPMAVLSQIAVLILASIMFIQIYNNCTNNKKKQTIVVIFSVMIILVSIGLGISYVSGWYVGGVYWHVRQVAAFECLTRDNSDFICPDLLMVPNATNNLEILSKNAAMLKQSHLGPFADSNSLKIVPQDPLLETQNWKNLVKAKGVVDGSIDHIDEQSVISSKETHVDKSKILIPISGWGIFDEKSPKVDSAYLFIDGKVQSKLLVGLLNEEIIKRYGITPVIFSGWEGWVDLRTLSDEKCHDISIHLVKGTQYYEILGKTKLCIEQKTPLLK